MQLALKKENNKRAHGEEAVRPTHRTHSVQNPSPSPLPQPLTPHTMGALQDTRDLTECLEGKLAVEVRRANFLQVGQVRHAQFRSPRCPLPPPIPRTQSRMQKWADTTVHVHTMKHTRTYKEASRETYEK
jgi:hypothetical protein